MKGLGLGLGSRYEGADSEFFGSGGGGTLLVAWWDIRFVK